MTNPAPLWVSGPRAAEGAAGSSVNMQQAGGASMQRIVSLHPVYLGCEVSSKDTTWSSSWSEVLHGAAGLDFHFHEPIYEREILLFK